MLIDITENQLTVGRIINVIKTSNRMQHRLLTVNGRQSDAFVYIIEGKCTYTIGDTNFTVQAGDILYLSHNSVYTMYIHTEDYRFIFCDFEFSESMPRKCDYYRSENAEWEVLFSRILKAYASAEANACCEAMSLLYRIYGAVIFEANKRYVGSAAKDKMIAAKNYIDSHLSDPLLSVAFLAESAGISEVYFRKLFRSQVGASPSQYIISARLLNAKKLMEYPFLTLEECALSSGFQTVQYFCRVFKKEFGVTPRNYRRK